MDKMTPEEKQKQTEMMQQSLLAERFHLKWHVETREMRIYELVPAKGGLKIKPVDPPPARVNAGHPGGKIPPGATRLGISPDGTRFVDAKATDVERLVGLLRAQADVGGRPIVDKTGFTGYFDIDHLKFSGAPLPGQNAGESDAPAISTSLEEVLGLRLVPHKAPVEVVVIDSIDRPTEN
jgi:uncharacterized protein (TIGR03435 family)